MSVNMLQNNKIWASCHCFVFWLAQKACRVEFRRVWIVGCSQTTKCEVFLSLFVWYHSFAQWIMLANLWMHSRFNSSLCRKTSRKCWWFFVEIVSFFFLFIALTLASHFTSLFLCTLSWQLFLQRLDMWWDLDLIDFHSLHVWSCNQLKSLWLEEMLTSVEFTRHK